MTDLPIYVYTSPFVKAEIAIYMHDNAILIHQFQADLLRRTLDAIPDFYDLYDTAKDVIGVSSIITLSFDKYQFYAVLLMIHDRIELCAISRNERDMLQKVIQNGAGICDWQWKKIKVQYSFSKDYQLQ